MKISLKFAFALKSLMDGNELNESDFGSQKKLIQQFLDSGAVEYRPVGNQRKKYYSTDRIKIENHLHHHFNIPSLENYIVFLEKEETDRNEAALATSDSKFKNGK